MMGCRHRQLIKVEILKFANFYAENHFNWSVIYIRKCKNKTCTAHAVHKAHTHGTSTQISQRNVISPQQNSQTPSSSSLPPEWSRSSDFQQPGLFRSFELYVNGSRQHPRPGFCCSQYVVTSIHVVVVAVVRWFPLLDSIPVNGCDTIYPSFHWQTWAVSSLGLLQIAHSSMYIFVKIDACLG